MFDVDRALILANDGTAWIMDISGDTPLFTQTDGVDPNRVWSNLALLPDGTVLLQRRECHRQSVGQCQATRPPSGTLIPAIGRMPTTPQCPVSTIRPRCFFRMARFCRSAVVRPGQTSNLNGEIFTPDYLLDASGAPADRPVILSAPGGSKPETISPVTVDDPGSIETLALLAFGATTHSFDMTARRIELAFHKGGGRNPFRRSAGQ